ncbi:hypothetical protein CAPTEDRAFT_224187 [Capitella teleta]|uniref:Centrobin n=1 Tax=Capitella teleta TaxID=283909 RepID=R7T665_CAPTE|nr:hypothetical protein CAPTEDRAFT_224187 [Capitella teleta]|eukprot:ELT88728.1 hypothetical protein CAPTEDRAFT_224187 [Capitella teleta]
MENHSTSSECESPEMNGLRAPQGAQTPPQSSPANSSPSRGSNRTEESEDNARPRGARIQLFQDERYPANEELEGAEESFESGDALLRDDSLLQDRNISGLSVDPVSDAHHCQTESDTEEEEVMVPMFDLQPVNHERDDPLVNEEVDYSESTEADQYVMQPEADQSEIGIVNQTEPRPVVVGRSDFATEYNDHLNEDNGYDPDEAPSSEDESQSDMPEDNLNFVNRQIEGEDEDEEGSVRSASSRGHSSLAQSDQNFGPIEITEQSRHDLVLMPQRVPPSGSADSSRQPLAAVVQSTSSPILSPASQRPHREAVLGATAAAAPLRQNVGDNRATRPKETANRQRRRPAEQQRSRTVHKTMSGSSASNTQPIMGTASLKPESSESDSNRNDYHESQIKYQQQLAARLRTLQMQHQSIQRPLEVNVYPQQTTPKEAPQSMSPMSQHASSPGGSSVCDAMHNVSMGSVQSDPRCKELSGHEVQRMENVRGQLAHMLAMSTVPERGSFDQSMSEHQSVAESFLMSDIPSQLGEMLSFTTQQLRSNSSMPPPQNIALKRGTADLLAENHSLISSLEEEKYRRKHCEKQIQQLQSKVLELQQQLAVSVSTDRKKNIMIEQLDKTLAKLVDNWQLKETEANERLRLMSTENEQLKVKDSQQMRLIAQFENQLTETIAQLRDQQEQAMHTEQLQAQRIQLLEQEAASLRESSNCERHLLAKAQDEAERMQRAFDRTLSEAEELRQQLMDERETWEEREREYLQRVQDMTDNHLQLMADAKRKSEDQEKKIQDQQKSLHSSSLELQQSLLDLEAAIREKESLKVEIGIIEAKSEAALRKLEADLQSQAEKELSARLHEAHAKYSAQEEQLRERHRRQMSELAQSNVQELQEQSRRHQDESRQQQDKWRMQTQAYEDRMQTLQKEITEARRFNETLEEQRQDITDKLQGMMQSHCNETLRLLQLGSQAMQAPALLHMGSLMASRDGPFSPQRLAAMPMYSNTEPPAAVTTAATASAVTATTAKAVTFQEPVAESVSPTLCDDTLEEKQEDETSTPQRETERGSLFTSLLQQTSSLNSSLTSDLMTQQEPERLLSQIDSRFEEHEQRQSELQYYINLLLSRPPGSSTSGSPPQNSQTAQELTPPRREPPAPPAFSKTTLAPAVPQPAEKPTLLSPQQVGEISRLLGLYHGNGQAERDQVPANELVTYLQDLRSKLGIQKSGNGGFYYLFCRNEMHAAPTQDTPSAPQQSQPKARSRPQDTHVIHIPTGSERNETQKPVSTTKLKKPTKTGQVTKKIERKTAPQNSDQGKSTKGVWK